MPRKNVANKSDSRDVKERSDRINRGPVADKNGVVKRPYGKKTDWELFKNAYINAYDKELADLCFEVTGNIDDPKYMTARDKCTRGKWDDLKRIQKAEDPNYMEGLAKELKSFDYTTAETIRDSRLKLVDANETIQKHLDRASELNKIVAYHLPRALAASKHIDWDNLAAESPREFFAAIKDLTAIMDTAIKTERISLDLANVKIDIVQTSKPEKEVRDYSSMSEEELSALYIEGLKTIDV